MDTFILRNHNPMNSRKRLGHVSSALLVPQTPAPCPPDEIHAERHVLKADCLCQLLKSPNQPLRVMNDFVFITVYYTAVLFEPYLTFSVGIKLHLLSPLHPSLATALPPWHENQKYDSSDGQASNLQKTS